MKFITFFSALFFILINNAGALPVFNSGDLISASALNLRFSEIQSKLSAKLINIQFSSLNENDPLEVDKINQNLQIIRNEGADISDLQPNSTISASSINSMFLSLNNFVDNNVIYLTPNNTANLNIFTLAGSRTDKVRVILNIQSGKVIYSTNATIPALTTGSGWHANTKIEIYNSGQILGMGGSGAQGGISSTQNMWYPGFQGQKGGDSIEIFHPVFITNNGSIYGGGGGGSSATSFHGRNIASCGGGGGGGQGYGSSAGGPLGYCVYQTGQTAGSAGSINGPGAGGRYGSSGGFISGNGGAGGTWGQPGNNSDGSYTTYNPHIWGTGAPTPGGLAGNAIKSNGNAVTWISGNNSTQVKGPIN